MPGNRMSGDELSLWQNCPREPNIWRQFVWGRIVDTDKKKRRIVWEQKFAVPILVILLHIQSSSLKYNSNLTNFKICLLILFNVPQDCRKTVSGRANWSQQLDSPLWPEHRVEMATWSVNFMPTKLCKHINVNTTDEVALQVEDS